MLMALLSGLKIDWFQRVIHSKREWTIKRPSQRLGLVSDAFNRR